MNSKFVVHKNELTTADEAFLSGSNTEIANGFAANTPAKSAAVNAILHEATLFVTAFTENMTATSSTFTITPSDPLLDVKSKLTNYIVEKAKTTVVDEAAKVSNALTLKINNTSDTYDGSAAKTKSFYAPSASGSTNQILKSNGAGNAPTWINQSDITAGSVNKSLNIKLNGGSTTYNGSVEKTIQCYVPATAGSLNQILSSQGVNNEPEWIDQSEIQAGSVANAITMTINNIATTYNGLTAKAVSFYAPETSGSSSNVLTSNGSGNVPTWTAQDSLSVGDALRLKSRLSVAAKLDINTFTESKTSGGTSGTMTFTHEFSFIERYIGFMIQTPSTDISVTDIKETIESINISKKSERVTITIDWSGMHGGTHTLAIQWICMSIFSGADGYVNPGSVF